MSAPDVTSVPVRPSPGQPACNRGPEQREALYRGRPRAAGSRSRARHVPGNG
jgi:hypothetical protein